MLVQYNQLSDLLINCLVTSGAPESEAKIVADEIVFAEARGKGSHGLNMLDTMIKRYKKPHDKLIIVKEDLVSCLIDGKGTAGPVVARFAMDKAIAKATTSGMATVGVRNPSPFLTAGYSAYRAAKSHNLIAIVMSVAKSKVAPFGTRRPIIGTNPIGFAFPAEPYPIVVDMAITKVPAAELEIAKREERKLPPGLAYDSSGNETTDPSAAQNGALIPFGGYKGSALGVIVELMSGAMLEAKCGLRAGDMRGMLFIAIKADLFAPIEQVKRIATLFREDVHLNAHDPKQGCLPGDHAEELYQEALTRGIEVRDSVYQKICEIAKPQNPVP